MDCGEGDMIGLLYISLIVALVYHSGFWDSLDGYIGERFGSFYHLPHIFRCMLCQCFWLSLLYVVVIGRLSLGSIVLCLINAHTVNILIPLLRMAYNVIMKAIEIMNDKIDL